VTAIGTAVYLSKADMLRANQDFGWSPGPELKKLRRTLLTISNADANAASPRTLRLRTARFQRSPSKSCDVPEAISAPWDSCARFRVGRQSPQARPTDRQRCQRHRDRQRDEILSPDHGNPRSL